MTNQTAPVPAKVERLLKITAKYSELESREDQHEGSISKSRSWVIRPVDELRRDRGEIWVFWYPTGANGGRVSVVRWYGLDTQRKLTQAQAGISIALLAGH